MSGVEGLVRRAVMGMRVAAGPVLRAALETSWPAVSDRELLRRFTEDGDQSAFAALVRRHGAMVLGACRRLLPSGQDAEDAFQATFLVLVQKAKSQLWQPSIAGWLYDTARKVARNVRLSAQRRARREGRAAVPEAVTPVDRLSGRELLGALDEELNRLPGRYREPLVLCYLEGLTRDEAASRLAVPVATLKSQLERGRKRLGEALTARGCALGAGLLALAATSPAAGGPSPAFVPMILRAALGGAEPSVAALAQGAFPMIPGKRAVFGLALLVGLIGAGLGARQLSAAKEDKPPSRTASGVPGQVDGKTTISGRVLDPAGKPVADAVVYLVRGQARRPQARLERIAATNAAGRFSCEVTPA